MKTCHPQAIGPVLLVVAAFSAPLLAQKIGFGGSSLALGDGGLELYHYNDTAWKITNVASVTNNTVTWTVGVTRGATGNNMLVVDGFVRVRNDGSAPAAIGNIVVNLQKRVGADWISAAADCADATSGDGATMCRMVKNASFEMPSLNQGLGPANYVTSGATGTFIETPGSGKLNFTDADSNTAFSISPQVPLEPGATINLLFSAEFDNTALGIPADYPSSVGVRAEVLVSFGNAGFQRTNGAAAANIDINGDGAIGSDEAWVRTLPLRIGHSMPPVEVWNDSVTLSDTNLISDIVSTGTVSYTNLVTDIGGGSGIEQTSASITRTISVEVQGNDGFAGGAYGGMITNDAHLNSSSSSVIVVGPIDPVTEERTSYSFPGRIGVGLQACDTADFGAPGFPMCAFCTFTQGGWGSDPHGHNPGVLLDENFATVYPSGIEVGIPGGGGFSMMFTSAAAVNAYLPAGGTPAALNADLSNPLSSSSGVFGGQVLALQINVDFTAAGIPHPSDPPIGPLFLCNTGTSLDGMTVSQILAAANTALGGGALPSGFTISGLNDLVTDLNEAFDNCNPDAWAQDHLCRVL